MRSGSSNVVLDPRQIFLQGQRFHYGYHVLLQPTNERLAPALMAPAVVVAAFAVELYLKCLVCMEGKRVPRHHVLKDIFRELAPETQTAFRDAWDAHVAADANFQILMSHVQKLSERFVGLDWDWHIDAASEVFARVRYIYEGRTQNAFFLGDFLPWMRNFILSKEPTWDRPSKTLPSVPIDEFHEL